MTRLASPDPCVLGLNAFPFSHHSELVSESMAFMLESFWESEAARSEAARLEHFTILLSFPAEAGPTWQRINCRSGFSREARSVFQNPWLLGLVRWLDKDEELLLSVHRAKVSRFELCSASR